MNCLSSGIRNGSPLRRRAHSEGSIGTAAAELVDRVAEADRDGSGVLTEPESVTEQPDRLERVATHAVKPYQSYEHSRCREGDCSSHPPRPRSDSSAHREAGTTSQWGGGHSKAMAVWRNRGEPFASGYVRLGGFWLSHQPSAAILESSNWNSGSGRGPVELTWPLVGRSTELERVTALHVSGRGAVMLAGAAGVGKTRLATECLSRAEARGNVVLRVSATSATAKLPFGAFASLLPEMPESGDLAVILRQAVRSITEQGDGAPVALMVDDAHLLDDSSALLLHQLVLATNIFVIVTTRSGSGGPATVVSLWKDGLLERIEVGSLPPSQVEQLLQTAMGGPIDSSTLQLFQEKTQGNAQLLRELVLGAVEAGALKETQGLWQLVGTFPISTRPGEIIENRLAHLTDREQRALAVIAVGEPVGIGIFEAVEPGFDVEVLERKGFVHVVHDDRRLLLRLDHPLHGEILRWNLSPLTSRRIAGQLAAAVEAAGARRRNDIMSVAVWRLEAGGPFRSDLMLRRR